MTVIENKAEYFAALNVLPVAIMLAEQDSGKILYANPSAEDLLGKSSQELLGQNQKSLHPSYLNQPERDSFLEHQKMLEKDGRISGLRNIVIHADGSEIHVDITANLVELEGRPVMIGVFTPTETRERAFAELSNITEELEAIFDNSQVGIMLLKGYRVLAKANQRLADILGYESPEEMLGMSMEQLHLSEARFKAYGKTNYDTLAHHNNLHVEYELKKKNGEAIWCHLSGVALDTHHPADLRKGVVWVVDDISAIKQAQNSLKMERNLFQNGPIVVLEWKAVDGWPIQYVSKNVVDVLGYRSEDLLLNGGFHFANLIHPDDADIVSSEATINFENQLKHFEQSYKIKLLSGEYRQFYDYTQVEYSSEGKVKALHGYLLDMTEYLQAQEISSLLLTSTNEGIFGLDKNGVMTFINPAAAKMLGYEESDLIGKANHHAIHHSDMSGEQIPLQDCRMMVPVYSGKDVHVTSEVLWRKDGTSFPVEYRSTAIYRDNEIVGSVVTFHDISYRKKQEERIHFLAFHDALTSLPNRRLFSDRVREEIKSEKRTSQRAALMLLDIDHFKDINDTLGHPAGDLLLKSISSRVSGILRESDTLARLGGDEFGILLRHEVEGVEAIQIAERIIELFKEPFDINGMNVTTNTSIGITFCDPANTVDEMVAQADIALYEAKNAGRGSFVFYEKEMANKLKEDVEILGELIQAVVRQEFHVFYQPQIDTFTEKMVGVEALIRWFPEKEAAQVLSSPAKFIPIAEKRGLIHDISVWQIKQLVRDIKVLREFGFDGRISINISGELLNHIEKLVELIELIEQSDLAFNELEFEITETSYAALTESENSILETVQSQGLQLAIDDFGTGYSSLSALRQLNSTHLKIDKQFIDEVHFNDDDYAIVSATISMAHNLGKKVIAEGVELKEQLDVLKGLDCDIIQGFYYAKPMPLDELCEFVKA